MAADVKSATLQALNQARMQQSVPNSHASGQVIIAARHITMCNMACMHQQLFQSPYHAGVRPWGRSQPQHLRKFTPGVRHRPLVLCQVTYHAFSANHKQQLKNLHASWQHVIN